MFTLDAYAARSCPSKVHNAFHPGFEAPYGVFDPVPSDAALAFKRRVLDQVSFVRGAVDLRGLREEPSETQEAALVDSVRAGAPVILGPLLPRDWEGHRSGRPDLLVRGGDRADGGAGYHPAQVKFHRVLEARPGAVGEVHSARFASPARRMRLDDWRYRWGVRTANTLQLAHYWRHLEALAMAAGDGPWAALVGTDEIPGAGLVFSWVRLDDTSLSSNPGDEEPLPPLQRYDDEHAFRVDLAVRAAELEPTAPALLRPVLNRECPRCSWQPTCRAMLGDDDLSVRISKSPLDVHEITALRGLGVASVTDLASADLEELLPDYLPRVTHRTGTEDRLRLAQRRARLIVDGVELERISTGPLTDIPTGALEIDLDIETSPSDRVYLWGFQVSGPDGSRYRSFADFSDLGDATESRLAERAMAWLRDLVDGRDAVVFHYSEYEVLRVNRLAAAYRTPALEWARDWAAEHFVDLFDTVRRHFFGTQGLGLKVVAHAAAGFSWRDPDPGGLNSQRWFVDAVHGATPEIRQEARTRVLEYNEDDVRATQALRAWLRSLDR